MDHSKRVIYCLWIVLSVFTGCKNKSEGLTSGKFVSTGGMKKGKTLCPSFANDVIVPLESLDPAPANGEPEISMDGIMDYIKKNKVSTITELLNSLPEHYQNNFSLVEQTRGEGQSSLNFPRIILFGPDGRFLMNVSTKPEDPKYDLLDCAELNKETGEWEFSQFDFTKGTPSLLRRPKGCLTCHGKKNPRPIWGTNLDWPGVFGDNEAPGPSGDALSPHHIRRMNEIRNGHGGSDRFTFLRWEKNENLRSGGFRRIADNVFGAELLVSNLLIGSAVGHGAFLRLKSIYPERYVRFRKIILLLAFKKHGLDIIGPSEEQKIYSIIEEYGGQEHTLDAVFSLLGIDTKELFSLSTLASEEPVTTWSLGDGDLYEQVFLQVLDDLSNTDPNVREILLSTPNDFPVFNCDDVVHNVQELVDYKMLHMYHLKGKARYEVNKVYYPLEVERIFDLVLKPVAGKLGKYLAGTL